MGYRKHLKSTSREYKSWIAMRQRCGNPKNTCYQRYGGRGITVCQRWNTFEQFYTPTAVGATHMPIMRRGGATGGTTAGRVNGFCFRSGRCQHERARDR